MQYYFLEKQTNGFTQAWKLRQVAFDTRYRYLYYSNPVSKKDLESGDYYTTPKRVTWNRKLKVTSLSYGADEYTVPPTSRDFDERQLLSLKVTGYERAIGRLGDSVSQNTSRASSRPGSNVATPRRANSHLSKSQTRSGSSPTFKQGDSGGNHERSASAEPPPEPEVPSDLLAVSEYQMVHNAHCRPQEEVDEMEDEDENVFRDIDLVAEDIDDLSLEESSDADAASSDDDRDLVLDSPTSLNVGLGGGGDDDEGSSSLFSFSFSGRRRPPAATVPITIIFRAPNYEIYRTFSLRVRQALVRHGLSPPLHRGLPPYDPRNGIPFATVPVHVRHTFRRLNDVVFYSFQIGHTVYLRNHREVRALIGYLVITHDSVLLLQDDGRCPRWLDFQDVEGIDYVVSGSHSFVAIHATQTLPDFIFIPIFPTYPLNSNFDPEESVEGLVSLMRRLLMQRLRAGDAVSLRPPSNKMLDPQQVEEIEEYDELCHIRDRTGAFANVFEYITKQGAGRPLKWRWDNSKTPTHFTYKVDLCEALRRGEDEEDEEEEETEVARHARAVAAMGQHEHVMPPRPGPVRVYQQQTGLNRSGSVDGSFAGVGMTVTQLLAPPSQAAELRAINRLRLTRTDPDKKNKNKLASAEGAGAEAAASAAPAPPPAGSKPPVVDLFIPNASAPAAGAATGCPTGAAAAAAAAPTEHHHHSAVTSGSNGSGTSAAAPAIPPLATATASGGVGGATAPPLAAPHPAQQGPSARPRPVSFGVIQTEEQNLLFAEANKGTLINIPRNSSRDFDNVSSSTTSSDGDAYSTSDDESAFDSEDLDDMLENPPRAETQQQQQQQPSQSTHHSDPQTAVPKKSGVRPSRSRRDLSDEEQEERP